MSARELVVLGTAAQVPTRGRNHNGYVLRWDAEAILFDPGEGTQRQALLAGVSARSLTRIALTHAHGDHCLGLPGMLQRRRLDGATTTIPLHYPAEAAVHVAALLDSTAHHPSLLVEQCPVGAAGVVAAGRDWRLVARRLDHRVPTVGYRLEETDGRSMLPGRLASYGISGPDVGRLQRDGHLDVAGRRVTLADVSVPRRGQVAAFVMDTRLCDAAVELAAGADLLVCESTFLDHDHDLADAYAHLTARQAAWLAREAGVRRLVLTHFSERYGDDPTPFLEEAGEVFDDVVVAEDLQRVSVPTRERPADR